MTALPHLRQVDERLIQNTKPFMYTEYPHKRRWPTADSEVKLHMALCQLPAQAPVMLYVHIPYCEQLCWFCTCHLLITSDYGRVQRYLADLYQEIAFLCNFLKQNGLTIVLQEIHLGGGSPTVLEKPEFDQLLAKLGQLAELNQLDEFSIEVDPRRVDEARLCYYRACGINRLSFGVQDFDPRVQAAINRPQPAELTERLLTPVVRQWFDHGINFDLICGLPHQTVQSITETCRRVVAIAPDRICLNYLHYAPEFVRHQRLMADGRDGRPITLPDNYERKELFLAALAVLLEAGYVRVGYDHFAKPSDAVAQAAQSQQMHWNALGATPGRCLDVIGLGVSSMSTLGDYYSQNYYAETDYHAALAAGRFPVYRAYQLSPDDCLRREVIQTLRSYFRLDFAAINQRYRVDCQQYFRAELIKLEAFVADGLVTVSRDGIQVTEAGCQFANLVCSVFDAYLT